MANDVKFKVSSDYDPSGINRATRDLKKMQSEFKQASKGVANFAKQNQETFRGMRNAGAAAFTATTAAAGLAVKAFATFEKKMSEVEAVSGATAEQMAALTDEAERLGKTTEFTAQEAADGLIFLSRAGFEAEESIKALGPALDFATANAIGLGESADIATNILAQFQGEVEDLPKFMDILSKTTATSNTNMLQMAEAMKFAGPSMAALGVPLAEVSSAIGILGNNGLQGSIATRALGTSMTRLAKPTDDMVEAMKNANLQAFDAEGNFIGLNETVRQLGDGMKDFTEEQRQGTIATLFGMEAVQEWNILLTEGADKLDDYTASLEDSTGQTKTMADIMRDNLAGSLTSLNSAFQSLQIQIGSALGEPLREILDNTLTPLLRKMSDWVKANPELAVTITKVALGATALVTALGVLGLAIGPVVAGITALLSPIGLVGAAIAGLAIIVVKNWTKIKNFTLKIRNGISSFFSELIEETFGDVSSELALLGKFFKTTFSLIGQTISFFSDAFLLPLKATFGFVFETIKAILKGAITVIVKSFKMWIDTAKGVISFFKNVFTGNFEDALDDLKNIAINFIIGIGDIFGSLIDIAKDWGANLMTMFTDGINEGIAGAKEALTGAAQTIKDFLGFASPTKEGPASDSDTWAPNFMKMFADGIIKNYSLLQGATEGSADILKVGFEEMRASVQATLDGLTEEFKQKSDELKQKTKDILSEFKTLKDDFAKQTAEDEKDMAEIFVEQQEKIKEMTAELNEKRKALRDEDNKDRKEKLSEEISDLEGRIETEEEAFKKTADLRKELSDEILEVERRNSLTALERAVEDFNIRRQQAVTEFNEKKALLVQELANVKANQEQIKKEYFDASHLIIQQLTQSTNQYNTLINQQKNITVSAARAMADSFQSIASAIDEATEAQKRLNKAKAKKDGGGATPDPIGFADGGTIEGGFRAFATGGVVDKPTLGLIGEGRFNEAVVPLPDGKSIPVQMNGSGGGNKTLQININGPIQGFDEDTVMEILDKGAQEFKRQYQFENF